MTHIKKLFLTLSLLAMQSAFGMDDIREGSYPYKYFPRPEKPPILTLAKYYPPIWSAPQPARPFNRRLTLEETRVLQLATQHTPVWVAAPAEPFDLALRPPEDMRLLNFSPAQEPRSSRYNNSHFTLAEIRQTKALFLRYLKMEPISFRLCQLTPKEQIRYINNHSKSLLTLRLIHQKTDSPLSWLAAETFNRIEQRVIENEVKQNSNIILELE